jgi:TolB protein
MPAMDWLHRSSILVVVLPLALSGCGGGSNPPLHGTIAFIAGPNGGAVDRIGAISADGSGLKILARGAGVSAPLRWSPDGTKLVFTMWKGGAPGRLYVVRAHGGKARRITGPKYEDDINPAWSPDGRRLVFDAQGDGWTDLREVNADGSDERKVTTGSYMTGDPATVAGGDAWSPDGGRIAYVGRLGRPAVMNADGSDPHRLKGPSVDSGGLSWSPNGREIVYDAVDKMVVIRADGTGVRSTLPRGGSPVWSPDGRKIVYVRAGDVYVVNSDGTGLRKVGERGATPSWSPDGRWIVYARFAARAGDIYVVRADGSDERQLTHTKANEADPVWSSVG